ncbi:MAG: hypothetical protein WD010_10220 [Nitriliruptor sp.]|uniref:hypothetical protein n=1 Tax=Nitriliruptor sp. TaxID=2448056 RepID=UPI0034A0514E
MLTSPVIDDDPDVRTCFAVTVAPAVIAPRRVARSVGDVVVEHIGGWRHDDVVLAVHDVLMDATRREPNEPLTVRVRRRDHQLDVEITDAGHLVRLVYRCPAAEGRDG